MSLSIILENAVEPQRHREHRGEAAWSVTHFASEVGCGGRLFEASVFAFLVLFVAIPSAELRIKAARKSKFETGLRMTKAAVE